jgi:hypothetical protein
VSLSTDLFVGTPAIGAGADGEDDVAGQDARSGRTGSDATYGSTAGSSAPTRQAWGSSVAAVLDARSPHSGLDPLGAIQLMPTEPRVCAPAAWLPLQGSSPLSGPIAANGFLPPGVAAMTADAAGLGVERINPTVRWWENEELADIGWAVEEVFADPTPSGELIRPYIDQITADRLWTGQGVVLPPTPVDEAGARGLAAPMPTRRQLRERRRAATSARAVAARRVAQGGVLAVTVFGVAAANVPHFGSSLRSGFTSAVQALDPAGRDGTVPAAAAELALAPAQNLSTPDAGPATDQSQVVAPSQAAAATPASSPPTSVASPVAAPSAPGGESVADALRARLLKDAADSQAVSEAAANATGVVGAVARAQAQADAAARAAAQAAAAQRKAQVASASRDAVRGDAGGAKALAQALVADRGWSAAQFTCLDKLWTRESNWNYRATNRSSGAYGIPQALPGSKMGTVAADWRTNPVTQIKWGLNYIASVYGTPCAAWGHSQATGWY